MRGISFSETPGFLISLAQGRGSGFTMALDIMGMFDLEGIVRIFLVIPVLESS